MSYPPDRKEYEAVPNYYYYYPPPQIPTTTIATSYSAPPIPGVTSTPATNVEVSAAQPPLPPGSENLYNYVCNLPPPPPPPPTPASGESVSTKHEYSKASVYNAGGAAAATPNVEKNKLENSPLGLFNVPGITYETSNLGHEFSNYHRSSSVSSNYSYPPPPPRYSNHLYAYETHYSRSVYSSHRHPSSRPNREYYGSRPYGGGYKPDPYYDNKPTSSSSHFDAGHSDRNYVGKRHRPRDDRPVKSETERDRLLRRWRSNYCETSEEIQRKMDELAEMDDDCREVWVRSSPADPYYKRTNNVREVEGTTRLDLLCELFEEKLLKRSEAIRESLPPYKPPPRQTRRRVCKHKSEGCSSSDSDSSDNEEFKLEQDNCMEELSRKLQHPYRIHADLWHNEAGEMNDGPLCRCSVKSRRVGIRHGIYPGEDGYPKCIPNSNNAHKLHHYRITISPPTNFLTKTPTIIKHDEHEFLFEGFSLLSHFPLVDLPTCKVIRFNIEYTILYVPEKLPENFTVRELDLFCKY